MRKWWTKRNVAVGMIFLAVLGWGWKRIQDSKFKANNSKIVVVERGNVVQTLLLAGEIKAGREADLRFLGAGKLGYIGVAEGDVVEKGKVLARLDTGDLAAAERAAYYNYLAADANAKQVEDEVKGHDNDETFVLKNKRVAAQTARDKAYDTWMTAQRALRNATLSAPFSGIVTEVTVKTVGQAVAVADGVMMVDPTSLYFEAEIDETDLSKVKVGEKVIVYLDAFKDEAFEGTLERLGFVSKLSDTGANVYSAEVKIEDVGKLRIGMKGDAKIVLAEVKNVLVLPVEAVVDGEVEKAGGERVKVETGLADDEKVEILKGLEEGEKIISNG